MLRTRNIQRSRFAALAIALLVLFAACGDDDTGVPVPDRTPGSGAVPTEPPDGEVNRPEEGDYVYRLTSTGENEVPAGTKLTSSVSIDGDTVTTAITNNQNSNSREIVQRWTDERVLLTSTTTRIGGDESGCVPEPPIELLRFPVKAETYAPQDWEGEDCRGTTDVEVTGKQRVEDAGGRVWDTWRIVEQFTNPRAHVIHYLSPALGMDIRTEDREALTLSVLESNPS